MNSLIWEKCSLVTICHLWLPNILSFHVVSLKICRNCNITQNHRDRTQSKDRRQPTDIATPKLSLSVPFVALLGKAKEALCLNKVETRIFETSGPRKTTAGPANKRYCSQTTTLPVSMAKDYKRSIYNRYSTRLSNRFSHETMAKAHRKNLGCRQNHNFNATGNRKT